jgi:hypothetical protein
MSALTSDRETPTVANPLIAADLYLSLDVLLNFPTQVTFDLEIRFDVATNLGHFVIGE